MSGQEHAAEAERLLDQAEVDARDPMRKYAEDANVIAAAQVHAALALAAEQRTANLIAYLAWEPTQNVNDAGVQLAVQVEARLGLTDGAA